MDSRSNTYNGHIKWCIKEEEQLISELRNEKRLEDIANIHNRTIGAIKSRIRKIIMRLQKEGKSIEEISNIMTLDKMIIKTTIESEEKYISEEKKKLSVDQNRMINIYAWGNIYLQLSSLEKEYVNNEMKNNGDAFSDAIRLFLNSYFRLDQH